MGAANVAAVLAVWGPKLGPHHAARVALVVMANTALDNDRHDKAGNVIRPKCVYFGGWSQIAWALGLSGAPSSQQQRVSRHLQVLTKAGAIEMIRRPAPGLRNARYLVVTLAPQRQASKATPPVDKAAKSGTTDPERLSLSAANACRSALQRLSLSAATLVAQRQVEEYEEPEGAKSRTNPSSKSVPHQSASRVDEKTAKKLARAEELRRRLDSEATP